MICETCHGIGEGLIDGDGRVVTRLPALQAVAERALSTPRDGKSRIAKADRRTLKTWMRRWCDERAAPPGDQSDGR